MRVAKTDTVAGLPAPLAREVVRFFRGGPHEQRAASALLRKNGITDDDDIFSALKAHGYLERRYEGDDDYIWWETTTDGNALAMTSFGKAITKKTADRLVAELVTRAREYNADADKPLFIDALRVFGSYLDPDIDPLGDVDIELSHGWRSTDPQTLIDYTKASGKHFSDYMDELFWPEKELIQRLRNRSAALNITTETSTCSQPPRRSSR